MPPQQQHADRAATPAGPTPDESAAHVRATAPATAAQAQSAELLESMSMPTGSPGATDPAAAQATEVAAHSDPEEATGGGASTGPGAGGATTPGDPYTVVAGDTLWKIAQSHYGNGVLWRAIYAANRAVIGGDANVISPGQELVLPALDTIITTSDNRGVVQAAFGAYWSVDVNREAGAAQIPVDTFRRVHAQLLLLPPSHVQGTWSRLLHLNDSGGAYMSHDGEFGLGENAATTPDQTFGTDGLMLTDDVATGATTIKLDATSLVGPGVSLTIGEGEDAEVVSITAVDDSRTEFTVAPAMTKAHSAGDLVTATNNAAREVVWLEAAVRHEIAHAIDGSSVDTSGFTNTLGGWSVTTSFDTWAAAMGTPWATNDGSVITDAEKAEIKAVIDGLRTSPKNDAIDAGLDPSHAIVKYRDKEVPVIEAAKPMAVNGGDYWQHPNTYHGTNGKFFTINDYYQEFHSFNNDVQYNQVRSYQTYSPAEFFAEVYSVYYEEAGTEGSTPGALVPVAGWKSWFDANVQPAVGPPAPGGAGGPSRGKSAGVSH